MNRNTYTVSEYVDTLATVTNCDSIITLNMTINSSYNMIDFSQRVIVMIGMVMYTTSGIYVDTATISGCDSVVTTDLTINPIYNITSSVISCNSYNWNGVEYYNSGLSQKFSKV